MSNLIKEWNGRSIRIREDRYTCLTDMAQATGKLFADWRRLKSTNTYLEKLSSVMEIPITELIQINQGGIAELQGTWGHPKVSIRFAQWCSDEFAVQVDIWIDELLTKGKVALQPTSLAETIMLIGQQMVDQERRTKELADKQQVLESKAEILDERTEHLQNRIEALNGGSNYYTVRGYCTVNKIKISEGTARRVGLVASQICKDNDYKVGSVPDERHGKVNSYPDTVLADAIAQVLKH